MSASPTDTLRLTQAEQGLCAYLTERLVAVRDGTEGAVTGFSSYATGGGGIFGPAQPAFIVGAAHEAAKAATESGALALAPARLNEALEIMSHEGIQEDEAARIGMAVIDVLARCRHHGGLRVEADPDALAANLTWVSNGAIDDTNRSGMVTKMCSDLRSGLDQIRVTTSRQDTDYQVAALVSWMQTAAMHECPELLGESIQAADALL